jgi:iron complex transport system ATP-binding protein
MSFFEIKDLHVSYGSNEIVKGVSFAIEQGQFCALLGLNGSGKTTILHAICGFIPMTGSVVVDDQDCTRLNEKKRAQMVSFIAQVCGLQGGRSVLDAVLMGFNPRIGVLSFPGDKEKEISRQALREIGCADWEDRDFGTLSQGQKQLVIIARCIVQNSPVMLMDEPDSALDFVNKHVVMEKISNVIKERNKGGLITLHDPNFAMEYCDKLFLLKDGLLASSIDMHNTDETEIKKKMSIIYGDIDIINHNNHYLMLRK